MQIKSSFSFSLSTNSMQFKFPYSGISRKMTGLIAGISLLMAILCSSSLFAQNPVSQDSPVPNKYNFSQFAHETWGFVTQPVKWDGGDWLRLGLLGAGTFLVMQADNPVRNFVNSDKRFGLDKKYAKSYPIEFGNMWGELYFTEILFGGFTVYALYSGDKTSHKIAFEIAQAAFYTFLVNGSLKYIIGRSRPYLEQGNQTYVPFSQYDNPDHQSLPGGHTGITMALTTVLSRNAKPLWLKILAYVPAGLSVISRVYLDRHWTSDVFFGGAIGYLCATWVVDQHEISDEKESVISQFGIRGLKIHPFVSIDSYGLGISLHL